MSNSKSPSFNFYSADFLVGVSDLTMTERGQYITLLCLQHQKGRMSKRIIDITVPNVSDFVLEKFSIDENGLYYNERLEQEALKRKAYSESRSNNIKKRWENTNANDTYVIDMNEQSDTYVVHMENEIENENINDNENNIDIDKNLYFQRFNEFWDIYPKKKDKERAQIAFLRIKPNEELFAQMKCALDKHKRSAQWRDAQYIPYPSTWLNGKRWEDEVPESDCSSFDTDDFFEANLKRSYGK